MALSSLTLSGIKMAGPSMVVAIVLEIVTGKAINAQPAVTNAGTLTCTVSNVPNKPTAVVDLSCNFKTQAGVAIDYAGSATTKTGGFPPAKHVFMWSVVAIAADKAPLLEGAFTAEAGREGAAVLLGGKDGSIRLEPVTGREQLAGSSEITTLTLKMVATKA